MNINLNDSKNNLILLLNIGSPDYLDKKSIKIFLKKFLKDKRVINFKFKIIYLIWLIILYIVILPIRSGKLLKKYLKISINNTSPLIYYTKLLTNKLKKQNYIYEYAFFYSNPSIENVLNKINVNTINTIIIIPLFPQFSSVTFLPVLDIIYKYFKNKYFVPNINITSSFYNNKIYIEAIKNNILNYWSLNNKASVLVFSYHSLPETLIEKGDMYYNQCLATSKLVASLLGLNETQYITTFQSKFGFGKWLQPNTKQVLLNLLKKNIKEVDIICPGFLIDCLETKEEIEIEYKKYFILNGGNKLNYIKCLNDDDALVELIFDLSK